MSAIVVGTPFRFLQEVLGMKAVFVGAVRAGWDWLRSPQARRYEAALLLGVYEAVRASLGHA